jgi:hypothetical protein
MMGEYFEANQLLLTIPFLSNFMKARRGDWLKNILPS